MLPASAAKMIIPTKITKYFQSKHLLISSPYQGFSASFFAQLYTTRMPVLIDIGFNDVIVPKPQRIHYPTLLEMPTPVLMGYTLETVIAEKFESIVKLALVNTRMKDLYDLILLI